MSRFVWSEALRDFRPTEAPMTRQERIIDRPTPRRAHQVRGNLSAYGQPVVSAESALASHAGLIGKIVKKFVRANRSYEDLYAQARLILVEKYDKWDPDRGAFSTYLTRVLNHGLSEYVTRDGVVTKPRYRAQNEGKRQKTDPGLIVSQTFPGHYEPDDSGLPLTITNQSAYRKQEERESLARQSESLSKLPESWQRVVSGRASGKTCEEVARELGISKQRVSALHLKALQVMRREVK